MTTTLTLADVTEEPPPFGSVVQVSPRKFAVFAKHLGSQLSCNDCIFQPKSAGCKPVKCFGGVYVPKNKYLEMRLLGEL